MPITNLNPNYSFHLKQYINGIATIYSSFTDYFNEWLLILEKAQKLIFCEECVASHIFTKHELQGGRCEVFDFGFTNKFNDDIFYFGFNVNKILSEVHTFNVQKKPIEDFLCYVNYRKTPINQEELKVGPLVIIKNPCSLNQYVLIDGNHRLSSYIANNRKNVQFCIVDKVYPEYFFFSFDWLMYVFQLDLQMIINNSPSTLHLKNQAFIDYLKCRNLL